MLANPIRSGSPAAWLRPEQDDLTEETEEIILTRSQNQVNSIKWQLEQSKARAERNLSTTIPREHDALKLALDKTQVTWRAGEMGHRSSR